MNVNITKKMAPCVNTALQLMMSVTLCIFEKACFGYIGEMASSCAERRIVLEINNCRKLLLIQLARGQQGNKPEKV